MATSLQMQAGFLLRAGDWPWCFSGAIGNSLCRYADFQGRPLFRTCAFFAILLMGFKRDLMICHWFQYDIACFRVCVCVCVFFRYVFIGCSHSKSLEFRVFLPVSDRIAGDYVGQFLFLSFWIFRFRLMVGFKIKNLQFLPIWISRFVLYYAFYSAKRTFVGSDVDSSERVIFSSFYSLLPTSIIDCHYCHQHLNHIIKFIKLRHSI